MIMFPFLVTHSKFSPYTIWLHYRAHLLQVFESVLKEEVPPNLEGEGVGHGAAPFPVGHGRVVQLTHLLSEPAGEKGLKQNSARRKRTSTDGIDLLRLREEGPDLLQEGLQGRTLLLSAQ